MSNRALSGQILIELRELHKLINDLEGRVSAFDKHSKTTYKLMDGLIKELGTKMHNFETQVGGACRFLGGRIKNCEDWIKDLQGTILEDEEG